MASYTFVLEYRGGTYISQVEAVSIEAAILAWAHNLEVEEIQYLGPKLKQRLVEKLENDRFGIYGATPLSGLVNAWCIHVPLPSARERL